MKKRFLVMLMIVAMSVSMFTACGDKKHLYTYEEVISMEVKDIDFTFDDCEPDVREKISSDRSYYGHYTKLRDNSGELDK